MRISVEMDDAMVKQIMELTGEKKMSTAIARAAELFTNRQKAVALIRSLREDPLDYEKTNDELEESSDPEPAAVRRPISYREVARDFDKR